MRQKNFFNVMMKVLILGMMAVTLSFILDYCNEAGAGSEDCNLCHAQAVTSFMSTAHKSDVACDVCHGDLKMHIQTGKKEKALLNLRELPPAKSQMLCLRCHTDKGLDASESFQAVVSLHDDLHCFDCHQIHRTGDEKNTEDSFREDLSVDCARCHQKNAQELKRSTHGFADLTCKNCHQFHQAATISRDLEDQLNRCLSCHVEQELEFKHAYAHPLRERQIKCSDCHNPHSDQHEHMLKEEGDETCAQCHQDIVIENGRHPTSKGTDHPFKKVKCMDCHRPHGSNFQKILSHPSDVLCQTCHL